MRFEGEPDYSNVEDRRGRGGGRGVRLGLGGFIVVAVASVAFGRNFFRDLGVDQRPTHTSGPQGGPGGNAGARSAQEKDLERVAVGAFNDAERFWSSALTTPAYRRSTLVLFWDGTRSACGDASAASGPFYCPGDEKVYIDLSFYRELAARFKAPGDFAQAYVMAHEIGHHVQHVLGTEAKMRSAQRRAPGEKNALSVRLELQADCYAGLWGHHAAKRKLLDAGDLDEALRAAAAIGDDRLQKAARGTAKPETFTHGTSAQRARWFRRGFDSTRLEACDTFAAVEL